MEKSPHKIELLRRIAELEKDKTQLQGILSVFTRQAEAVAPKKK